MYGGRGAAKSWTVARKLLIRAVENPIRVLCCREVQNSIADSVHKLLSDQIGEMGLGAYFDVGAQAIYSRSGAEFLFTGLRQQEVRKIKSYEGVDIAWVEEAQNVSRKSWETLIPTIRKDGSEIWVTFNPYLETDETYQRFVLSPMPDGLGRVVKIGYQDNPWFPEILKQERDLLKARDYEAYLNVWEGQCVSVAEGAIFGKEMIAAQDEGRIGRVPFDPGMSVSTYWDLGIGQSGGDTMAIWFEQHAGGEIRLIDYLEGSGEGFPWYAKELDRKPYNYDKHWAPHDIEVKEMGSGRTRRAAANALGIRFSVVPRVGSGGTGAREERIHASRLLLPRCWFDADRCRRGLNALRSYRRAPSTIEGEFRSEPVHDFASHAADAFGHMAVALKEVAPRMPEPQYRPERRIGGWMAG